MTRVSELLGSTTSAPFPDHGRPIKTRTAHTPLLDQASLFYDVEAQRNEQDRSMWQRLKITRTPIEVTLHGPTAIHRDAQGHNPNITTVYARTMRGATIKGLGEILRARIALKRG